MTIALRSAMLALALAIAEVSHAAGDQHRRSPAMPAPAVPVRNGISGNSVARTGAHGAVGGPAARKPFVLGSINLKQPH